MGCCVGTAKRGEATMATEPRRVEDPHTHSRKSSKSPDESKQTCTDPKSINLELSPSRAAPEILPKVITLPGLQSRAFVLSPGFLLTTAEVLPTAEDCPKALPLLHFRPDLLFFCHPELNFSVVALEADSHPAGFQATVEAPPLRAQVSVGEHQCRLDYAGGLQLYYQCSAAPGTPITHKDQVVGMHDSPGRGVSVIGIANTLAHAGVGHCFTQSFGAELSAEASMERAVFSVLGRKLASFDVATGAMRTYTKTLPAAPQLTYFLTSLILTGGMEGDCPVLSAFALTSAMHHFDSLRDMTTARAHHCACVLDSFVFVVSGLSQDGPTNECEKFNPKKNQWLPIYPIARARVDAGCAAFKGAVYVYGGCNKFGRAVRELERFADSSWADVPLSVDIQCEKTALVATEKRVVLLAGTAVSWDLRTVKTLGKVKPEVSGQAVAFRDGVLYLFSGGQVWEGRMLANSIEWKSHDCSPLEKYLAQL